LEFICTPLILGFSGLTDRQMSFSEMQCGIGTWLHNGGPVGLETMAFATTGEDPSSNEVKSIYEPRDVNVDWFHFEPERHGTRVANTAAWKHLDICRVVKI
jgi:Holliday junction resolvasome RuvABC ATP-dependent DNA helicase subunit